MARPSEEEIDSSPLAQSLYHIGVAVSDLDRSIAWYGQHLDAPVMTAPFAPASGIRAARLSLGNAVIELTHNAHPTSAVTARNCDPGASHIAVHVPDVEAAHERLRKGGLSASTPPAELMPGVVACYFRDPDGVQIQLIQLPSSVGDKHGLRFAAGLHHFAFTASDLERTLGWYERGLGLRASSRATGEGELVSRMFEVPESRYKVALVPLGSTFLEIMEWEEPRGKPQRFALDQPGAWHLGVRVKDGAAAFDVLHAAGVPATGPLRAHNEGRSFFVRDPDGIQVQLTELLDER